MKRSVWISLPLLLAVCLVLPAYAGTNEQPNVIVLLTDDHGYGDVGVHGHPFFETPYIDQLHEESVRFTDFHVTPMCSPTRGQLLTGVDAVRNGATFVNQSRTMPRPEIPTLGNYFSEAGYRTALMGKWHLGSSYPYRPQDRGFQEVIANRSWGMPAMASHWGNNSLNKNSETDPYHDPYLEHNGTDKPFEGYVTDVLFDKSMAFIRRSQEKERPFFLYLPTQTPHVPNIPPHDWHSPYRETYDGVDVPEKYYGMIANIDENVKRLDAFLKKRGLREDTILVFISDNGTQSGNAAKIFNAGMRGKKRDMWEGGHRVYCYVRWPGGNLKHGRGVDALTQVQDIAPTLLELTGLNPDRRFPMDGKSLVPLLRGKSWPHDDRTLFVQYGVDADEPWNKAVAMHRNWRLVGGDKLYNLAKDPAQQNNVADQHPDLVERLRAAYAAWHDEAVKGFAKPRRIHLGHPDEEQVTLYASDWKGDYNDNTRTLRESDTFGYWEVHVETGGRYRIELARWPFESGKALTEPVHKEKDQRGARPIERARLQIGEVDRTKNAPPGASSVTYEVELEPGPGQLNTTFINAGGEPLCSANYVRVTRLGN